MQKITIGDNEFALDVGAEMTVRERRKVQPVFQKKDEIGEMEMVIEICKVLSNDDSVESKIDGLSLDQFTELSTRLASIIEVKKK